MASDLVPTAVDERTRARRGRSDGRSAGGSRKLPAHAEADAVERRLKDLAMEIAAAERAGDTARRDALVMENLNWTRRRSALLLSQLSGGVIEHYGKHGRERSGRRGATPVGVGRRQEVPDV